MKFKCVLLSLLTGMVCHGGLFASSRPETWFHLIGGNVSKEGLTADLEAIKAAGIGGIHLFHGQMGQNLTWPGVTNPVPCLSAQWDDMIAFAGAECKRLGLSFKMQNCPGWSMSGGPWIRPANAMRVLTYSRLDVTQAGNVRLPLPAQAVDVPADRDYHDLFVMAFPTPKDDREEPLKPQSMRRPSSDVRVFTFAKPVVVRTVEMNSTSAMNHNRSYEPEAEITVYAVGDDGAETPVTHQILPPGNWQDNRKFGCRQSFALDEAEAKVWKLVVKHVDSVELGEVRLFSSARYNQWQGAAGWTLRGLVDRGTPRQDAACWIDTAKMIDLTGRMAADGTLLFEPPHPGPWTLLRIGHVNGLYKNGPAPAEATGWECSKLAKAGIEANYAHYIGRLVRGPVRGNLGGLVVDSWECFRQNWTDGLDGTFAARRGYALLPRLPALFGWVVDDPTKTEAFLRDWRGFIGDLIEENYYGHLARLAHADGLTVQYETAFGDALAGDLLAFWKHADIPMCEFWNPTTPTGVGSPNFKPVMPCVSAAHVYGKKRVAAEAFAGKLNWNESLRDLKPILDRHFARGVTFPVFHTYTHNPQVGFRKPGTSFGYFIGTPFLRGQTWWRFMPLFTDYCARCTAFLEEGLPVVDILRVLGDGMGHKPDERAPHFRNRFKDDYVNRDVLLHRLSVREGRLALPDGMSYSVLWVPAGTYLDETTRERLESLKRAGARVVNGGDPTVGIVPDVVSSDDSLLWYHRRTTNGDHYFVAAPDKAYAGRVTFRGRSVDLDLAVGESRFVSFALDGTCAVTDPVTGRPPVARPTEQALECAGFREGDARAVFSFSAQAGEKAVVDLGRVEQCAEVSLNGKPIGRLWCAPYRLDLTGLPREGENRLEVVVTATWYNALRQEADRPESERTTWTLYGPKSSDPPMPAGLYGKVLLWRKTK